MSVIVTKILDDKIILAADSILIRGATQEKKSLAKIKKIDHDFGFAACGLAKEIELLFLFCKTRKPRAADELAIVEFMNEFSGWLKTKTDTCALANSYHIVFQGKAFDFYDYYCTEILTYSASGVGQDFALAALYFGKSASESIEVACELSVYCEKPITIFEFNRS